MGAWLSTPRPATAPHLAELVRVHLAGKVSRGMRITPVAHDAVLLEDLDEWSWTDFAALQLRARSELTADVFAASGGALPGLAVHLALRPCRLLLLPLRVLLCVALCLATLSCTVALHDAL